MLYISSKKYYKLVNEFSRLKDNQEIINTYPHMFDAICCYNYHLPNRIIKSLFRNLGYGNWEHLWETDEEKEKTINELCDDLKWEVYYCSDRMSWDRLLRTHWIWQRILDRLRWGENKNDLRI